MKKTGLLFGSFNPIHIGHLMIAGYMYEFSDLDELWFVVSPLNPLKEKQSLLADHHRLEMVNLAIDDDTRFRSCNIEFKLPKPSFTSHTLTYLQDKYPELGTAIGILQILCVPAIWFAEP
jgi:nicotinate-nucleotide adenylyltransferase